MPRYLPEIVAREHSLVSIIAQFPRIRPIVETRVFPDGGQLHRLTPERFRDRDTGRIYGALTGTSELPRSRRSLHEAEAVREALRLSRIVFAASREVRQ